MATQKYGVDWRGHRLRRGVLVLAVVLLMHVVVVTGVRRELAMASAAPPTQTTISVALLRPPPPPPAPIAAPAAPERANQSPTPRTPTLSSVSPPQASQPTGPPESPEPSPEPSSEPLPESKPTLPAVEPPVPPAPPSQVAEPSGLPPAIKDVPTRGRIAYRTTYTRLRGIEALTYVDWSIDLDRGTYELWLRTVDPPGLLDLRSSGQLKPFGIAPGRYLERVEIANRELSVEFDWSSHIAHFAGRGAGEPMKFDDGTQDPLSLQFHMPLLAQAYPWRFSPGSHIAFQVARRRIETYVFTVEGFELIWIGGRALGTMKIVRPKTPESPRGVEFWVAPELDWIPVRLRFVDTNNEVWDSQLAALPGDEPPAAPIQQEEVKP